MLIYNAVCPWGFCGTDAIETPRSLRCSTEQHQAYNHSVVEFGGAVSVGVGWGIGSLPAGSVPGPRPCFIAGNGRDC